MPTQSDLAQRRYILERLRERYEQDGYGFLEHPAREFVPDFLRPFRPDAIAVKDDGGVVVQVVSEAAPASRLAELTKLFAGRPDWRLEVVSLDIVRSDRIEAFPTARIRSELDAVDRLAKRGELHAAFLVVWGLLEAAFRAARRDSGSAFDRPVAASQMAEILARHGLVTQEVAGVLRRLGQLRNGLVHGDLNATVTPQDVNAVVDTIKDLLDQVHQPA